MTSIATVNKTEKIEKLADALSKANEAVKQFANHNDGGTCNIDTVVIKLKNWKVTDIEKLNELSSVKIDREPLRSHLWRGYRIVNFKVDGRAGRRYMQIQAAWKSLSEACKGIFFDEECSVVVFYQMD